MTKPFKNITSQIDILSKRNLIFLNTDFAERYLLHNNYYDTINRYKNFFISDSDNFNNVTFESIVSVHNYDRKLKKLLFNYLVDIEKHFKSIIIYRFCEEYNQDLEAYLKTSSYISLNEADEKEIKILIGKFRKIIDSNIKANDNNSIKHYHYNNNGIIPLWVVANYITLGHLVYFYNYLEDKVKNKINKDLSYFVNDNNGKVTNFINSNSIQLTIENLAITRNISAHNNVLLGYIYKNDLPFNPDIYTKFGKLKTDPRKDLYSVLISMQYFLNFVEFQKLYHSAFNLTHDLKRKVEPEHFEKIISSIGFDTLYNNYIPYSHKN